MVAQSPRRRRPVTPRPAKRERGRRIYIIAPLTKVAVRRLPAGEFEPFVTKRRTVFSRIVRRERHDGQTYWLFEGAGWQLLCRRDRVRRRRATLGKGAN